jgi:hypothetical protein
MGFNLWNKSKARIGQLFLPAGGLFIAGVQVTSTAAQLNAQQAAMRFVAVIDCSANPNYPAASAGDVYKVSVAGKIGGASGPVVQAGDILTCVTTSVAGTHAAVGANWFIEQGNVVSTADVPASTDKNYVTDAQLTVIGNTSGTNTGDVANAVVGAAAGYKIARSAAPVALDGSNPTSFAHGLTTCVTVFVQLVGSAAPGDSTSVLTAVINGANIDVYAWMHTTGGAAGNPTLVASTGTETFNWIAIGT